MNKQDFINAIRQGAIDGYTKYKILPSLTMAQAILESGWGKNHIQNNLFGIKAGTSWNGKVAIRQTKEFINGKWITVNAKFRAYNSFNESIEDHAKLLGTSKRYKPVTQAQNYKQICNQIWKCGYATDPNYPNKLIRIIEQNKLYQYDRQAKKGEGNNLILKVGSRGKEVKKLQNDLKSLGYDVGVVDGIYGQATKKAVEQFQVDKNIQKDGVVGKATFAHLKNANPKQKIKQSKQQLKNIKIKMNNKNMNIKGIYQNNINYIPIRFLENMGFKVGWDNKTQTVVISLDKIKINFKGKEMLVDGICVNGKNYIPIRFLENAKFKIDWDNKNKMVVIE